jgi:hypothetical protein
LECLGSARLAVKPLNNACLVQKPSHHPDCFEEPLGKEIGFSVARADDFD